MDVSDIHVLFIMVTGVYTRGSQYIGKLKLYFLVNSSEATKEKKLITTFL